MVLEDFSITEKALTLLTVCLKVTHRLQFSTLMITPFDCQRRLAESSDLILAGCAGCTVLLVYVRAV